MLNCIVSLDTWSSQVDKQALGSVNKVIVACKSDLGDERAVDTSKGKTYAEEKGYSFFETSAKDGDNVTEAWEDVVRQCIQTHKNK